MDNKEFIKVMKNSFDKYLETGSRSNEKLKILHGAIAEDIAEKLGEDYKIHSLGYGNGREVAMKGRYMDKKVDIAIKHKMILPYFLKKVKYKRKFLTHK